MKFNKAIKKKVTQKISCVFFLAVSTLFACNPSDGNTKNEKLPPESSRGNNATVAAIPSQLYSLKLYKYQVDKLFATRSNGEEPKKIVLQFYIDQDSASPKLVAYPAKNLNKFFPVKDSQQLWIENPVLNASTTFYFGDNQVHLKGNSGDNINKLINSSNPAPHDYSYLRFTPDYNPRDKHIYYIITVVPTTLLVARSLSTQPSPPADAE